MIDPVVVVLSTCANEAIALRVATALVTEHLAACVNRIGRVGSTYFWEGRLQDDAEILLIIKTTRGRLPALEARFKELHPYDVPELVAIDASGGSEKYLDWVRASVQKA